MKQQHILVVERKEAGRWYDNPDMSDLMFAMLSMQDEYKNMSLCLHMYDKDGRKGISKVELDENRKWKPTEVVDSLEGKILYHPILTVSTTDSRMIKTMFDSILDGIDFVKGSNGTPTCIIIPVLMSYNHFGTLVIKPAQNAKETEVYYFNPLGTLAGYAAQENEMFAYMKRRYAISEIVHNSKERWQTDSNQCGPYSIWFVQEVANLVLDNGLNKRAITEHFQNIWKWGDVVGKESALQTRDNHADYIVDGCNTNFSIPLFLGFKKAVLENANWHSNIGALRFENPELEHQKAMGQKLMKDGEVLRDVAGVDTFEAQPATQEMLLEYEKTMPSIHAIPVQNEPQLNAEWSYRYQAGFVVACAGVGALAGYMTKQSLDIDMLNKLASFVTTSDVTAAIIKNSALGLCVGVILIGGYNISSGRSQI